MHVHAIQIWIRIPSEVEKSCCSAYRVALTVRTEWEFAASPLTMAFPSVSLCRSLLLSLSLASVNHLKSLSCMCVCACENVLFLMALSTPLYRTSGDRYHAFRNSSNSKRLFFSFFFFWSKCCYFRAVLWNWEKKRKCVCMRIRFEIVIVIVAAVAVVLMLFSFFVKSMSHRC